MMLINFPINMKNTTIGKLALLLIFCITHTTLHAQNNVINSPLEKGGENIRTDSLMMQRGLTIGDILKGRSSGVNVINSDGAPGAAFNILIRGGSSLRGNKQPTYILDGVFINPAQIETPNSWGSVDGTDYQSLQNMLWSLNTSDIESIQILKDASATAIYGSKGANGIIIINTKTGSKKEKEVSWTSNMGVSSASRKINFLSPAEYKNYYQTLTGNAFNDNGLNGTDWQREILKAGFTHNHAFSMRGSMRRTDYYVSLTGSQQSGIIPGTGSADLGLRANINQLISPRVKTTAKFAFFRNSTSMTQSTYLLGGSSLTHDFGAVPFSGSGQNPLGWVADYDDNAVSWRAIPQAALSAVIADGISLDISGGVDFINKVRFRWMGNQIDKGALDNSRAGRSELSATSYNADAILKVDKKFGNHNLLLRTGAQYFGENFTAISNYGADFSIYSLRAKGISFASRSANAIYDNSTSSTIGGLFNFNYKYSNKYELEGGIRADYLINFNTGYYPSLKGIWNISEENFWKQQLEGSFVGKTSVHAGWGVSGKNEITSFSNIEKYSLNYGTLWIPFEQMFYFTPRLETNINEFHTGFDLSLLDERIQIGAKYYQSTLQDMLSVYNFRPDYYAYEYDGDGKQINKTLITFNDLHWQNNIRMQKLGVEGYVNALVVKNNSFTWKINVNFAVDRTKITDCGLPEWNTLGMTGRAGFTGSSISGTEQLGVTAFVNGSAPNVFYGYKTQGIVGEEHVNMVPPFKGQKLQIGDPKYIDTNNNGQVEETDKVIIGNPNPDLTFGINNTFTFGKITLNVLFDGMLGNDILNLNLVSWDNVSGTTNVLSSTYENRWISGSTYGKSPRVGATGLTDISDRMIEDGSFLRLSNISASYPLNVDKINWLSSLDISLYASNLFVITGYSGYSPDVNSFAGNWSLRGIDAGAYPQARTLSVGFTAKF